MKKRGRQEDAADETLMSETVSPLNKGMGALDREMPIDDIGRLGWNLLREDLSLPAAVLYEEKMAHNLKWMQQFIEAYGMKLAPHGKTTMAPKLFARQLQTGAWGITLATAHQTRVAHEHGVRRVLMANQLVGKQNMATVARLLEDTEFEYFCLVDSAENVEQLGSFFRAEGRRLNVLIEVGVEGGRTGVRDRSQLDAVLDSLERWRKQIRLSGIELFEGVLDNEASIRGFLGRAVGTARELARTKRFDRAPFLLSGAGSAWYDVVAEEFSKAEFGDAAEIVLRPGCYLTHDVGAYRTAQQRIQSQNPAAKRRQAGLQPALQVWAYVQSVPEKQRAIVAMGKRDAAFDSGLPTPALHYRLRAEAPKPAPPAWELTKMMDQHSYLRIGEGDDIQVGDMIGFDISHPCLTFDKWRYLSVLDANYKVMDVVQTYF
ncbi:MAG TPA: amino acid deaminase [Terriglobales bacterium]|nr:amino acid deaminase [Terriglobales bacterium]